MVGFRVQGLVGLISGPGFRVWGLPGLEDLESLVGFSRVFGFGFRGSGVLGSAWFIKFGLSWVRGV